jgi:hypothetical protein
VVTGGEQFNFVAGVSRDIPAKSRINGVTTADPAFVLFKNKK